MVRAPVSYILSATFKKPRDFGCRWDLNSETNPITTFDKLAFFTVLNAKFLAVCPIDLIATSRSSPLSSCPVLFLHARSFLV
jgi:hypothetical protein